MNLMLIRENPPFCNPGVIAARQLKKNLWLIEAEGK